VVKKGMLNTKHSS